MVTLRALHRMDQGIRRSHGVIGLWFFVLLGLCFVYAVGERKEWSVLKLEIFGRTIGTQK